MGETLPALMVPVSSWLRRGPHQRWLDMQGQRLLDFYRAARVPDGFAALDDCGNLQPGAVSDATLGARMTHVYAVAAGRGLPGCGPLATHGVTSMLGPLADHENGGWFLAPPTDGQQHGGGRKQAYLHAFVVLAASSATVAGLLARAGCLTRRWRSGNGTSGARTKAFSAKASPQTGRMRKITGAQTPTCIRSRPAWRPRM